MRVNDSPMFMGIGNLELQAWNRCAIFFNLMGDEGTAVAQNYVSRIPVGQRPAMQDMFDDIKSKGYEATKRRVIRNNNAGEPYGIEA